MVVSYLILLWNACCNHSEKRSRDVTFLSSHEKNIKIKVSFHFTWFLLFTINNLLKKDKKNPYWCGVDENSEGCKSKQKLNMHVDQLIKLSVSA